MTKLHNISADDISADDWTSLRKAVWALEHPSLAARLTSVLGTPIEEGLKLLPTRLSTAAFRNCPAAGPLAWFPVRAE